MAATMNAIVPESLEERPRLRALRFLMAGSVDDGKSTLTGRLLYETQAILGDQLGKLRSKAAGQPMDLSQLTDGLEAEREQGITIDVAYRYFSTPSRKFIIADAPGHEQYTRNMVTAAAGSDAAVILVDITKLDLNARPVPLLAQTRRHTLLAHLLRVPSIVFAINKIDAVADPKTAFEVVRDSLLQFTKAAGIDVAGILPISALRGDNVTTQAGADWYDGPTLLEFLEVLPAGNDEEPGDLLVPVQYVSRDPIVAGNGQTAANSARVIWGRVARGSVKVGDSIQVFPSNERATVVEVRLAGENVDEAEFGQSAGIVLDRHVDVARGNWLSTPHSVQSTARFSASLAWMDTEPAQLGRKYLIRHGSRWVQGRIVGIESCLDIHTLEPMNAHALAVNEIGQVTIETQEALPLETFNENRAAGSMIVIDPSTHHTSGALLVTAPLFDSATTDVRASVRVRVGFAIDYKTVDSGFRRAKATNISVGGLLMTCDDVLMVGGALEVKFEGISVHARLVAHRPAPGGGYNYHLAFYGIGTNEHEAIARIVNAKKSR